MASDGQAPGPTAGDPRHRAIWLMEPAQVLDQAGRGDDWFKLTLLSPQIAARAVAGQFVEVAVHPVGRTGTCDPLLKRPLSICQVLDGGVITLIYRTVGRGTHLLSQVRPGEQLELIGPLGHSFPDPSLGQGRLVLVGGGLGIPPMALAAAWAHGVAGRPVRAILGARSAGGLAGIDEVAATGVPVTVVTDDGSAGRQALVTTPLGEWLDAGSVDEVWACGPEPMLAAVKALCQAASRPCWVSLERHMACGFGVCISCTVPKATGPGYWKCCTDGPVFPAAAVEL